MNCLQGKSDYLFPFIILIFYLTTPNRASEHDDDDKDTEFIL